jgi:DNA mismatch endonuclease, patch repair protein
LRADFLDSVGELYTEDGFPQLVVAIKAMPAFFGGLGELEDHGERGLVRAISFGTHSAAAERGERAFDHIRGARMLPVYVAAWSLVRNSVMEIDPNRSALMSRIRSSGTGPELVVRRLLHARGLRFRLHRKDLPGSPDIILPRYRLAIFVHGCFWHQHPGCRLASKPKSRNEYWDPKLATNVERDARAAAALQNMGWRVETIWECDVRQADKLTARIEAIISNLADCPP